MLTRRVMVASTLFILSFVLLSCGLEPPVRSVLIAFSCGVGAGTSLMAFAYGISAMAAARMQKHIAEKLMAESPIIQQMYQTRVVPPVSSHEVHLFVGKAEDVIKRSMD